MTLVCGADGCRAGWVAALLDLESAQLSCEVFPTFRDLAHQKPAPTVIALDVPIGLPDLGPRVCDTEARRMLGARRASSVFPAPIRPILAASSYPEASSLRRDLEGKGLSVQAWAIVPKVREVDTLLRDDATLRRRIREVHPELCFYYLAGNSAMSEGKKTQAGRSQRRSLLEAQFGDPFSLLLARKRTRGCAPDDVVDAFVALWTARRIAHGQAVTIPAAPPRDRFDLPMEMVA